MKNATQAMDLGDWKKGSVQDSNGNLEKRYVEGEEANVMKCRPKPISVCSSSPTQNEKDGVEFYSSVLF